MPSTITQNPLEKIQAKKKAQSTFHSLWLTTNLKEVQHKTITAETSTGKKTKLRNKKDSLIKSLYRHQHITRDCYNNSMPTESLSIPVPPLSVPWLLNFSFSHFVIFAFYKFVWSSSPVWVTPDAQVKQKEANLSSVPRFDSSPCSAEARGMWAKGIGKESVPLQCFWFSVATLTCETRTSLESRQTVQ